MNTFRSVFQQSKWRSGIHGRHWFDSNASHSAPSTRQDGAYNVNKQRKHNGRNKPQVATWVLCVDVDPDNPESDPMFIATLDMPLDGSLISVALPGNRLGECTALAARTACQAIDKVLKRHLERGGGSDTVEMLDGLHIDPMGDIRDGRP